MAHGCLRSLGTGMEEGEFSEAREDRRDALSILSDLAFATRSTEEGLNMHSPEIAIVAYIYFKHTSNVPQIANGRHVGLYDTSMYVYQ